ncbi:MAG: GatB/YqeY domain-containing protein [Candidatus Beckwithbacteria bacterium GW2011_GWB1_47_15]|uniref:GatB/YqeY domain-containing protein n=1 Tax=Candidatus Beckwithbacteria bacterium GW2011_GWB1_47_15 TaxID=1618371 RepID=A0A0G1UUP0_9BACT|nr:MAG: hypothetical protein UY43_C0001G0369 [Candidatus Beckwithbacteria bacterium GW2011_GWC1_49_16]KKU35340.1 MAG: GatB/YqeY domain-containing protein [Candidatus Beckwithbacteria bacterium GW2011_GWA1_46_30]KKU61435.1 MAG: GatB/YqeY domain-containing protein [Candidatus Beckwithbacteria bacterium GW2011_GWB1_47_15]KKU71842.1 MAG: GatB/YqeY domain-containing protein [Candidatus Beckwithbacteria bacterium GW2011_GWA2_47_25]KKW03736.1 MAG: GatB/YqeY domain-containing protein [Candidatus Beckwi
MISVDKIRTDLNQAVKAKDADKVSTLRMLLAALHNAEIEKKGGLESQDVLRVLKQEAKKRQESIEAYRKGGRPELADKETSELKIIKAYLPQEMGEEEIRQAVKAVLAEAKGDFGQAMKLAMVRLAGKADGAVVARIVKQEL